MFTRYGPDHQLASSLVGLKVKDTALSFWGGAILEAGGKITAWGPDTLYYYAPKHHFVCHKLASTAEIVSTHPAGAQTVSSSIAPLRC